MARDQLDTSVPDLSGRLAVVTGASDGLGLGLARRLADAGAEVVMPVRNQAKGQAAGRADPRRGPARQARRAGSGPLVAGLRAVPGRAAARRGPADQHPDQQRRSDDAADPAAIGRRLRMQFATNHLGHYALTARLLPLLRTGRARITTHAGLGDREIGAVCRSGPMKARPLELFGSDEGNSRTDLQTPR